MLLGGIFFPANVAAQKNGTGAWRDFDCVARSEAWLSGYNASGLTRLPNSVQTISIAEIFANKSDGEFINYSQSNNSFTFGAQTESFFRLSNKTVLYGKVDYKNFTGQNMGGSAFINPDYNAFNIDELGAAARGEKSLEQYGLIGAIGVNLSPRLSLGGKVDYLTANYAKHKDLRHKNSLLDLTATIGAAYQLTGAIEVGANYIYRRSVESIEFDIYGNTDQVYSPLIDFGAFYGRTELFGESGYTKDKLPVFNQFNGAALQVNLKIKQNLGFFNEFSYLSRSGQYGTQTTSVTSVTYTEHKGTVMAYSGVLSFIQKQNQHLLKINLNNDQLTNWENIFMRQNTPGGLSETIYLGKTQVLDRNRTTAGLEYTAQLNVQDYCPEWLLKVGANFDNRRQTVSLYPYFRKQNIYSWNSYLFANKNITSEKNQYGISLKFLYGSGGGDVYNDGLYATPSDDLHQPVSSDYNLYREYEYLTANRIAGNIGCSYSRIINRGLRGYVHIEYGLTKAFDIKNLDGSQFGSANLSIGCNF